MSKHSWVTEALVLTRKSIGESDRLVTLFTPEQGKITAVAKSARTIKSRQRASLEPGSHIKCLLIGTKSMPLLTQTTLLADCQTISSSLPKLRQLSQLLEMVNTLFVENEGEPELFEQIMEARSLIVQAEPTSGRLTEILAGLIESLGYQHPSQTQYATVTEYVQVLADRQLHSWEYLKVG